MQSAIEAQEVNRALDRIEEILGWSDQRLYGLVETVSRWSPAQQVEHILLGLARFAVALRTLEEGTDAAIRPRGSPRILGRVLLWTGWIPRGRAQAPEAVVPDAVPSRAGLKDAWREARATWVDIGARARELRAVPGTLPHPLLGSFRAVHWLRFANVHTRHHLAIIADIDRTKVAGEPEADPLEPVGAAP